MIDKLKSIQSRYQLVLEQLSRPEIISQQKQFMELSREQVELQPTVEAFAAYEKVAADLESAKTMASESDAEMAAMAREEIAQLSEKLQALENQLKLLLTPKDPNDGKNVFIEIRAGAGGDEAALFVAELFRMYCRFAERHRWQYEVVSANDTGLGGYKEVILLVAGKEAFRLLRHESGVHRVQRVPKTEAQGRIHTSTVTVAVLPEVDDVDVQIRDEDLRIDVFRAGGPGGQSVNTTDSAVRITHIPTGIVVSCQDEKSQLKNRIKGMKVLRARIQDMEQQKQNAARSQERRSQVGTGDRSERIRTYNFPQTRVTDHRINFSTHNLDALLDGDLDELVGALNNQHQMDQLLS